MVGLSRRVAELRPSTDLVQREMFGQIAASLFGEPSPPVRVGRYSILSRVGVGGMGTVFAAWDHALQRRVALKVLHREHGRAQQDRILDEARALAKLAHPNVVAVFDAGRDGDDAFVAMELVVGAPLGLRVRRTSPTPEQLARWLADAAAGLAAAHDVGLVHGDVKPSNLLLGDDDRVRVIDFGLAIAIGMRARGGTAGYLAPEIVDGIAPTAAADVYALCVTADELIGTARWPKRMRRAITRARADDPRARGTMNDLLAALRTSARASSHRRLLAGTVLVGLGLFALGSMPTSRCPLPIDSHWHDGLRERAEQALARHGERGAVVWSAVSVPLDRRASAWLDARDAACAMPLTTRDPIAACLEDHAVGLEATVEQLEREGPLPRVDRVLAAISEPQSCLAQTTVASTDVVELRHGLVRVQVAEALGDYPEALRLAIALDAEARRQDDELARASAEIELGELRALAGDAPTGVALLHDAYFRAWSHHDERLAVRAIISIIQITGDSVGDLAAAERWRAPLEAALARGDLPLATRVRAFESLAWLAEHAGDWPTMRAMADTLLREDPEALRSDPALAHRIRLLYAGVLRQLGDPTGQLAQLLAAVTQVSRVLPPEHPDVGLTYIALGSAWDDVGELALAEAALKKGIALLERAEIFDRLGDPHYLLGRVYMSEGEHARARTEFETAARLIAEYRGAQHPDAILPLVGLAELATLAGDFVVARAHYEAALAMATRASDRAYLLFTLGTIASELREWDRAIALHREARLLSGDVEAARLMHCETLYAEAHALRGRGDVDEARTVLQQSLALAREPPQLTDLIAAAERELAE